MENDAKNLIIEQIREGNKLTCKLAGWLDPNTSPNLITQIDVKDLELLVFDMKNIEYVFSSGLRSFLILQKMMEPTGGRIKLINVSDDIRNIFEYTGFESMLEPRK
jgi:anti-anti-sigma factor